MNRSTLILGFLLAPISVAFATSFIAQPFPDTVQQAATIVRGRAGNSFSNWATGPDGRKRIYTYYDLQVEEVFKGDAKGSQIEIRELGGEVNGVGMQVAGAAHFNNGEDVVVMLGERNPDESYDVRGLMTGKFAIRQDESGNEYLVGAIADDEPGEMGNAGAPHRWTLTDLRKIVASQAQASSKAAPVQTAKLPSSLPSPLASPRVAPSPALAAPHLQTSPSQGASQSPDNPGRGVSWIVWLAAILFVGAFGTWWITRNKK